MFRKNCFVTNCNYYIRKYGFIQCTNLSGNGNMCKLKSIKQNVECIGRLKDSNLKTQRWKYTITDLLPKETYRQNIYSITNCAGVYQTNSSKIPIIHHRTFATHNSKDIDGDASFDRFLDEKTSQIEIGHIKDLFPRPKNTLSNIMDDVANQLKNKNLRLSSHYNHLSASKHKSPTWSCTYNIKWPEEMKFVDQGKTKQEASHKAALSALMWLKKQGKITKVGQPVLIDNQQMESVMKSSTPTLTLEDLTQEKLKAIVAEHNENFVSTLVKELDDEDETVRSKKREIGGSKYEYRRPKMLGMNNYLAKEKIHLPISDYKDKFMELLNQNRVIIVKGEPGCGKSTRVPQYILESWILNSEDDKCRIVVTQPRRIAAVSLAERVADERDENVGHIVGYQVRLKSNFREHTGRILYCTTGVLLRHIQSDPNLENFTHIILDEAHERDVNTDVLMNILRETMKKNDHLKVIVMSATIDAESFADYFGDAPIFHVPGFTYPVKTIFLDDCPLKLDKTWKMCEGDHPTVVHEDVVKAIDHIDRTRDEGAILCFLPGWEDIMKVNRLLDRRGNRWVLCLHSRLQDSEQKKIFANPPPGIRKIILATNVAETSVTINDVVYVVDTGIHKEKRYDTQKGIDCMDNEWISKASAGQRRGRAGRVRPGECLRLYPESLYARFKEHTTPEILRTSLTKTLLNSKTYSDHAKSADFMGRLLQSPGREAVQKAVDELHELGLFDDEENLTPLGETLVDFQLEPKLAKVLVNSVVYKCVTPIVDIVTLFAFESEFFASGLVDKDSIRRIKSQFDKDSDHLAMMRIFEKWLEFNTERNTEMLERFCTDLNLVSYKFITVNMLRKIHFDYLYNGLHDSLPITDELSDNEEIVKAVLLSGVGTILQHRNWDLVKGKLKKSNVFLTKNNHKATITPESVNYKKTKFPSNFLVYINETRSNIRRTTIVRECSVISPLALLLFSNKELRIVKGNTDDKDNDRVRLVLDGTKIEFSCRAEDANDVIQCKEALQSAYQYFIYQMTKGGEFNKELNACWDRMLDHLNDALSPSNS